jgi:hypothetical protein
LPLLLLASNAFADAVITSVTPNSGPVAGGTRITIKGSGFTNTCILCSPPIVSPPTVELHVSATCCENGAVPATDVKFIDATTLEATTPARLPATYSVVVRNPRASNFAIAANAFTYTGDPHDGFEPILFPIFTHNVYGAFGSIFYTSAVVYPKGDPIQLYGEDSRCDSSTSPARPAYGPLQAQPIDGETPLRPFCNDNVARILWTPKGQASSLAAGLRVGDASRATATHGTEIPVVRESDFTTGKIVLLDAPFDARLPFRVRLRIYSLAKTSGPVTIEGVGQVALTPAPDFFTPSYAEVTDLPPGQRIVILPSGVPLWAFATVTNNDTQQITTITPQ